MLIELCAVRLSRVKNTDWTGFGVIVWFADDDCFAVGLASPFENMRAYAEEVGELLPDITSVHVETNREISARHDPSLIPWNRVAAWICGSANRRPIDRP